MPRRLDNHLSCQFRRGPFAVQSTAALAEQHVAAAYHQQTAAWSDAHPFRKATSLSSVTEILVLPMSAQHHPVAIRFPGS
jgi:hypothetical protein